MDAVTGSAIRILQPANWPRPKGYSNDIAARGEMIFVAGLIGWDQEGRFADGFVGQFRQTLLNTVAILKEADARPEHIVRMTWYVVDRELYLASLKELGAAYREVIGPVYPAMAVVQVVSLMEPDALIEIETTAVRP